MHIRTFREIHVTIRLMFISKKYHWMIQKQDNPVCTSVLSEKSTFQLGLCSFPGLSRATIKTDNSSKIILYAHLCFQGNPHYNWAYVHFQEVSLDGIEVENYYPSHIIGFITLQGITEAVIQCAEKPLLWSDVETIFFLELKLVRCLTYLSSPFQSLLWYTLYVWFLNPLRVRIHSSSYYQSKTGVVSSVTKSPYHNTYIIILCQS